MIPDYPKARPVRSPNCGARVGDTPADMEVEIIILHYTGMKTGEDALARLCDPEAEVSSHYLIEEDGTVIQLVSEADRAWHAGDGVWQGREDINSRSIGIEIVNPGHELGYRDFPGEQIAALIDLCKDISRRHTIAARHVLAHSDIAPGRKQDPGEKFPWDRLHRSGVGHFVAPAQRRGGPFLQAGDAGEKVSALQAMLTLYGYGVETGGTYGQSTFQTVSAFQSHFRPELVDGIADISTIETLHRLLSALDTEPA